MRRPLALAAALAACCCAASPAAAAVPEIHAHRGGSVVDGVPTFAEETLPAFRHAWVRERAVLELDVKLTADRVPVVIHDDTMDRTTTCAGPVAAIAARGVQGVPRRRARLRRDDGARARAGRAADAGRGARVRPRQRARR